jgi:hypothetical protein
MALDWVFVTCDYLVMTGRSYACVHWVLLICWASTGGEQLTKYAFCILLCPARALKLDMRQCSCRSVCRLHQHSCLWEFPVALPYHCEEQSGLPSTCILGFSERFNASETQTNTDTGTRSVSAATEAVQQYSCLAVDTPPAMTCRSCSCLTGALSSVLVLHMTCKTCVLLQHNSTASAACTQIQAQKNVSEVCQNVYEAHSMPLCSDQLCLS